MAIIRQLGYVLAVLSLTWPAIMQAKPVPAWVFTNGAVLQRGRPLPVWGMADPGEEIVVSLSKAEGATSKVIATGRTVADPQGQWIVRLPAMRAENSPLSLSVAGKTTVTFADVLVGDVWVCSGQSNMTLALRASTNGPEAIANSAIPELRLLTVPDDVGNVPLTSPREVAQWLPAGPYTTPEFSAVAFYFGREMRKNLDVPIGLIHASSPGSKAELWTPGPAFQKAPSFQSLVEQTQAGLKTFMPTTVAEFHKQFDEWYAASTAAASAGKAISPPPQFRDRRLIGPSSMYNGMIAPLQPYAIAGVLWYQGESNSGGPDKYRELLPALIQGWRSTWGQGDIPFLIVQLPNEARHAPAIQADSRDVAAMREAQYLITRAVPNTGLAVIIDVGGPSHPPDKLPVGYRLALLARALVFGDKSVVYSGPLYRGMEIKGQAIRLQFDHLGGGLVAKGGTLKGFAIAGADRKFIPADAVIKGNEVVVSSPDVSEPKAVRYAWANDPPVTLFNVAGLPAMPFRTDDWPRDAKNK